MSCEDHGHDHGHGGHHDHSHAAPIPTNPSQSLVSKIDLPHVNLLNLANHPDDLPKLFKLRDERFKLKPVILSDCDSQFIINIPFLNGTVKLFSIILRTNGDNYCPKTIKLWKNDRNIDFENAANKKPTFTITHPHVGFCGYDEEVPEELEREEDFVEHHVPRHIFSGVQQLTMFIENKHTPASGQDGSASDTEDDDDDIIKLHYLELRGEFTELAKDPVITMYELAANPADHKNLTMAKDTAGYSLGS